MDDGEAIAVGEQRQGAEGCEAFVCGVAMATGSPRVGDQRVLMVVVTNDPGVAVLHPAFGAGDQPCAHVSAVLAAEVDDYVVNARCERADLAILEDGDARRFERVAQRRGEIAGGDHIAERGLVVIAMVDHGAAEAALLGDVNGVDRGGIERRPDAESFERQAASVRKRERAGIASCGEAVAGVGEGDVVAAVLECEGQREADRACPDDQQIMMPHRRGLA